MWLLILFAAPLLPLPVAHVLKLAGSPSFRSLKIFSAAYLVLQILANAYLWYCYLAGYRDWMVGLLFPYLLAYLGIPIGATLLLIVFYADRHRRCNGGQVP
jgi:hypothetical protein